jgi:hypothetical protein
MASHRPVIVGINQYQTLQPLMFAQFDAIELKDFLVKEAGVEAQDCSLLADISSVVYQGAAHPSREVILQRLRHTCEQAAPEDTVWFFFSGYGVHWQGQDYLLPIDGDPTQIEQTGIAVQSIVNIMTMGTQTDRPQADRPQGVIMLDMNRPLSAVDSQRLGIQSMDLARQAGIPLVLACQPEEFSQDSLAVRHGLFATALIEGMRFHGCVTLAQVGAYLTQRVPELCRHHFRPPQNPVLVVPPEQQFMLLLPPTGVANLAGGKAPSPWPPTPQPIEPGPVPAEETLPSPPPAGHPSAPGALVTTANRSQGESPAWVNWLLGGLGILGLLLLGGVLLRNQGVFWRRTASEPPAAEVAAEDPNAAAAEAPGPGDGTSPNGDPVALFPGTEVNPVVALEQARTALEQQQYADALAWLNQIPEDQRPEDYEALLAQAEAGYADQGVTGEEALAAARRIIEPVSASLFNDAIEQARQVSVNDPDYAQAQIDIQRWSRVILDLAEGRAAVGNLDGAIAAASLVPDDQTEVYSQAQRQIQRWQQRQENRRLLQQAQDLLEPGQATSFQTAIALSQQIPPDYPEYPLAQERIDQWSRDILAIAQARAADGDLPGAIAAASLVPPDTSAYDQAQGDIQSWQGSL